MKVDLLPKGMLFTRLAIAMACAKGKDERAAAIAANRWGDESAPARLLKGGVMGLNEMLTKAAVAAGTRVSGNWAADLVSADGGRSEFFSLVRQQSILGRVPGFRRVPLNTRLVSEASGFSAAWVGEGKAVPVSHATYSDDGTLPPLKVSALGVFSDELLESVDPAAEMLIRDGLVDACARAIDTTFLDPANAGTSGVEPASVTNGVSAVPSSGDGLQDVRNLIDGFAGDLSRAVLIGTPATFATLHDPVILPSLGIRGGEAIGIPAIPSNHAGDDLILIDPGGIALGEGGAELKVSTEGSIQMSDAPTNDAVTPAATTLVSLWQCNSAAIMAERYINWQVEQPSVAVVTGVATS
jgi:hypothetical protein